MFLRWMRGEPPSPPKGTSSPGEGALCETLLRLLPWAEDVPMVVVHQFTIPPDHAADLVGVDLNGNVTIVECKLERNPESGYKVVGQILFYAAGLAGMSYDEFDRRFRNRRGASLAESVAALVPGNFDERSFRQRVAATLASGRFRLVIAVDAIPDLLRILERYLNEHAPSHLQITVLALGDRTGKNVKVALDEVSPPISAAFFFSELAKLCSPKSVTATKQVFDFLKQRAVEVRWGRGSSASVNVRLNVHGRRASVLGLYAWPGSKGLLTVNFGYMADAGVPVGVLRRFAERLSAIPEFQKPISTLEKAGYRKFPSIQIDPVLARPGVVETIQNALDEIIS